MLVNCFYEVAFDIGNAVVNLVPEVTSACRSLQRAVLFRVLFVWSSAFDDLLFVA